jgi:hypothetical protein
LKQREDSTTTEKKDERERDVSDVFLPIHHGRISEAFAKKYEKVNKAASLAILNI